MTPTWEIRQGHVLDVLRAMPAESVHCVVTSPPYYGLRDYGLPPQVWGGRADCEHRWVEEAHRFRTTDEPYTDKSGITGEGHEHAPHGSITCGTCGTCGAWRGSLGLEPTPELFIQHLVEVFAEVHRVLRDDGTLWLNLGDSYANDAKWGGSSGGTHTKALHGATGIGRGRRTSGLPPKSLLGIPWRVALTLQAAGWVLRSEIIWHKPNAMPESVRDRPTRAHETLFLLSKRSERYFYDAEAVREPAEVGYRGSAFHIGKTAIHQAGRSSAAPRAEDGRRNKRSVWTIATAPFSEAHFATFPPDLIRPCIRAGTSERGCCSSCGAPMWRLVERVRTVDGKPAELGAARASVSGGPPVEMDNNTGTKGIGHGRIATLTQTVGWEPTCDCDCGAEAEPCKVLDPFSGAATSGLVALEEGRSYLGVELNPAYAEMSERRLRRVRPVQRPLALEASGA